MRQLLSILCQSEKVAARKGLPVAEINAVQMRQAGDKERGGGRKPEGRLTQKVKAPLEGRWREGFYCERGTRMARLHRGAPALVGETRMVLRHRESHFTPAGFGGSTERPGRTAAI